MKELETNLLGRVVIQPEKILGISCLRHRCPERQELDSTIAKRVREEVIEASVLKPSCGPIDCASVRPRLETPEMMGDTDFSTRIEFMDGVVCSRMRLDNIRKRLRGCTQILQTGWELVTQVPAVNEYVWLVDRHPGLYQRPLKHQRPA